MEALDLQSLRGFGSRRETARLRVYAFHHAGGSASGYLWRTYFPDEVEVCAVQLPGREGRLQQAPFISMGAAVRELTEAVLSTVDLPYAFFGHGMGALIAFDVTRRLRAVDAPLPRHLFLSGWRAPHLSQPAPSVTDECLAHVGDVRQASLDSDTRELYRPLVRADMIMCQTYRYEPAAPLPCPITVIGGRDDPLATEPELRAWEIHTAGGFNVRLLPGGHFYLRGAEHQVAEHISETLAPVPSRG